MALQEKHTGNCIETVSISQCNQKYKQEHCENLNRKKSLLC